MTAGIARLYTDTVQVAPARTGRHPGYADPVAVACYVNDTQKLVIAADGTEVVSPTTIYASLHTDQLFLPAAKVTLPSGRTAQVITVARKEHGPANAWHLQIAVS